MSKKSNSKEFIEKCQKKYGNIYDYSKVNYETAIKEVLIGCPKHGFCLEIFEVNVLPHLKSCSYMQSVKELLDLHFEYQNLCHY